MAVERCIGITVAAYSVALTVILPLTMVRGRREGRCEELRLPPVLPSGLITQPGHIVCVLKALKHGRCSKRPLLLLKMSNRSENE